MTGRIGAYPEPEKLNFHKNKSCQVQQEKRSMPLAGRSTPLAGAPAAGSSAFREVLEKRLELDSQKQLEERVKFSAHAERRLKERNIELGASDLLEIDKALRQAAAKGSRESLLVYGDIALVTSVKNRTVVTALVKGEASGRIFTNIDSTVLIDKKQ